MGCFKHLCYETIHLGRERERFILTVIDCFSRYLILIPINDHSATTVSEALYERVVGYFGCPWKILSDRGTEFTERVGGGGINGNTGNSTGFGLSILSSRQRDHRAKSLHCWQHGAGSAGPPR